MKKTTIVFAMILLAIQACDAQKPDLSALSPEAKQQYETYMKQKYRANKAGYILLGSGFGLTVIGLITGITGTVEVVASGFEKDNKAITGVVLFTAGIAGMVASIPCFITAGSKKRKAELLLKGEKVSFNFSPTGQLGYAAVGVRVRL